MPNGNFLQGLSEGIFSRLGDLRKEQEAKDTDKKQQAISLLSSLADRVEPESLPILMGHLGDLIGVKGQMKGFWDAFSGMPNRSVEDQLGTKLREITGGMVGADTAKVSRDQARKFLTDFSKTKWGGTQAANVPQSEINAIQPASLQGKMVFRDPRQERLDEIQTKYEGQMSMLQKKLDETQADRMEVLKKRDEDRRGFEKFKSDNEAVQKVKDQAAIIASSKIQARGGKYEITDEDLQQAAGNLIQKEQWGNEKTQAVTNFLNQRALESKANTDSIIAGGGIKKGEADRLDIAKRAESEKLEADITSLSGEIKEVNAKIPAAIDTINRILKSYAATEGLYLDRNTGEFKAKPGVKPSRITDILASDKQLLDAKNYYTKLLGIRTLAQTKLKGKEDARVRLRNAQQ